ncbi:MAG TPA: lipoyl(octanoyl) transferase LipB [Thermoleophilaceae bacterium]|jgi:lipoate-protein ligase B
MADLRVTELTELVPYEEGLRLQDECRDAVQAGGVDQLLLLEHEPVYTKGRRTKSEELPMGEDWYLAQGIAISEVDRGGAVTYHGPGQLVGYPIMRIEGVHEYVAALEHALIAALADEGVEAEVRDGLTGVWASKGKIASIGVHVSRRVTTHGFAVNVDNDLQPFEWIVPCGMEGAQMSSICKETGRDGHMRSFREAMVRRLCDALDREPQVVVSASG